VSVSPLVMSDARVRPPASPRATAAAMTQQCVYLT